MRVESAPDDGKTLLVWVPGTATQGVAPGVSPFQRPVRP
jgi:hypothetical protein